MSPSASEVLRIQRFRRMARWCAAFTATLGAVMLAVWVLSAPLMRGSMPWPMKANTALALLVCGAALLLDTEGLRQRRLRRGMAVMVAVLSGLTLVEYATGVNLWADTWLALDHASSDPGRMRPQTALAFLILAVGLFTLDGKKGVASCICDCALVAFALLLNAVTSGLFDHAEALVSAGNHTRVSPQTIIGLTALWVGLLLRRADAGLFRILGADGRGSQVIRYLLPPAICVPLLFACLQLWATVRGTPLSPLASSALAMTQQLLRIGAILGLGYLLNHSEVERRHEQARREEAERLVAMCAWTKRVRWHGEWVPIDRFLAERFGIEMTHGISEEALSAELDALELTAKSDIRQIA